MRRLLAFGRQQVVQPRPVKLNEVFQGLRPVLERVIGERIQMIIKLAAELHWINGDVGQLEQVLMNLEKAYSQVAAALTGILHS